jgi:2-beta-glucuronyltransferase
MTAMSGKRVLIVTGQHFAAQPRKVDLHFMAEALNDMGIPVDFLSLRLSQVSRFIGDGRWEYARSRRRNQWVSVAPMIDEYIWMNAVHPLNLKKPIANRLSGLFFRFYGELLPAAVIARLPSYSHIMVESGIAALLIGKLRRLAPDSRIIYHAADRLATIGTHPVAAEQMAAHAADLDLAHIMAEAIRPDIPPGVPVIHLSHGISKAIFEQAGANPYAGPRNAISVGDMLFDAGVIETLAEAYPDWTFHLFGRLARLSRPMPNVVTHGEVAFERLAAYIRHADIGLAAYLDKKDADYLSQSSLKMIQYTFCRLPIVAPAFAAAGRAHVCPYRPGQAETIVKAFAAAIGFDRTGIDASAVMSWQEKTRKLLAAADKTGAGAVTAA